MGKGKTIVVCDMKVDRCSQLNEYMNLNNKGRCNSRTFVQGHSDSTFSNFFSLETATLIETKFHVEPPWDGVIKVNTKGLCHMIKNGRHVHIW